MKPEYEMALGIALMLLAGVASMLLGWWFLGGGLVCVGVALAAAMVATRRPLRRGGHDTSDEF